MFAVDAAVAPSIPITQLGKIGRSYSSSAACLAKARTRFLTGSVQGTFIDGESFQNKIGSIFESSLPIGVTGLLRKAPSLIVTVDGSPTELNRNIISINRPAVAQEDKTATASFKTRIEIIQSQLGLSITQLAQLFGVTRKSVYDWMDNATPRSNIYNRMEVVSTLISQNKSNLDLKRLKNVWLMSLNGRSFIDVISDESVDEHARLAAVTAKLEELAPRLGQSPVSPKLGATYLGNAHAGDVDRVADLG